MLLAILHYLVDIFAQTEADSRRAIKLPSHFIMWPRSYLRKLENVCYEEDEEFYHILRRHILSSLPYSTELSQALVTSHHNEIIDNYIEPDQIQNEVA